MRILCSVLFALCASQQLTFTHWDNQPYTKQMVLQDFTELVTTDNFLVEHGENLSIENGLLTFQMIKDKVWVEGSGAQIVLPIKPQKEMILEYEVYFDGGDSPYDWTTGGKLPGIAGGRGYTGGEPAGAGDGFSARLMFGVNGQLYAYVYHVDMKGKYGESLGIVANNILKQYEWNTIKILYRMNTHDDYNGRMEVWANGEYVGEKNHMRFCTNYCSIDKFLLVSFHGGQTPDYRPSKNQKVKFRSFSFYY